MSLTHRTVATNGIELHVAEDGAGNGGTPVILCHGWPELWYSWRHQLPALAAAGHHVVAPDQRGYGQSSRPEAITDYDLPHLTGDLIGLLDDLGQEKAVFVGHDWGSMVVWDMALRHPDRVAAVVGMSVPFIPRGPMKPTELFKMAFADNFFYILYFQEPGVAEAEFERDVDDTMRRVLVGIAGQNRAAQESLTTGALPRDGTVFLDQFPRPDALPDWLSEDDLAYFVEQFEHSGYRGGINWYRNLDRNWELNESFTDKKVEARALFITGAEDPVIRMTPTSFMDEMVPNLEDKVSIAGAGHWVQQEAPGEVNDALIGFLQGL